MDRKRSVSWLSFVVLVLTCLGACEKVSTSDRLLGLSSFELDPESGLLRVQGSGFPPARACELRAEGTLYEPGHAPRSFHASSECRSTSEYALLASVIDWQPPTIGSSLFEGQLQVTFADDRQRLELRGSLPNLRIRLRGSEPPSPERILVEAREARSFQRMLGISDVEAGNRGLIITALHEGSAATRAGLHVGDIVTRLNGGPIEVATDLRGQPGLPSTSLEFLRAGEAGPQRLEIPHAAQPTRTIPSAGLLLGLLGAVIGVLVPFFNRTPAGARTQGGHKATVLALGATLLALSSACCDALDVRAIWMVPALVHFGVVVLARRNEHLSTHELLHQLLDLGTAGLSIAALGLARGSLQVPFGGSTPLPWTFALFASPCGWLAGLLLLRPQAAVRGWAGRSAILLDAGKLAALLAFATTPLASSSYPASGGGTVIMIILATLLLHLQVPALPRLPAALLGLATIPLAFLAGTFESSFGALAGPAACGFTASLALRSMWNARQPAPPVLDRRLSPFA